MVDTQTLNPETPPDFTVQRWFNTDEPITLAALKGKVVFLTAFQMQCQASLKHGLPQAARMAKSFNPDEVAVIAINTAFEDHDKQAVGALEAFIRDNGLTFPIAKDKPDGAHLPKTAAAYQIRATPTVLVFDRQGRLRRHYLGEVDDIRLAAEIIALVIEFRDAPREQSIALERRLAAALVDPNEHGHQHDGECCGGAHKDGAGHSHEHPAPDHVHSHDGGCCGGAHDHDHDHGHSHAPTPAKAKIAKLAKAARARR